MDSRSIMIAFFIYVCGAVLIAVFVCGLIAGWWKLWHGLAIVGGFYFLLVAIVGVCEFLNWINWRKYKKKERGFRDERIRYK